MTNYLLYRKLSMMTAMIRAIESTTIPTISPILSPPESKACSLSAAMVVTVVVVTVVVVTVVVVAVVVAMKHHRNCDVTDHGIIIIMIFVLILQDAFMRLTRNNSCASSESTTWLAVTLFVTVWSPVSFLTSTVAVSVCHSARLFHTTTT